MLESPSYAAQGAPQLLWWSRSCSHSAVPSTAIRACSPPSQESIAQYRSLSTALVAPSVTGTVALTDPTSLPQKPCTMPSEPPASWTWVFDHSMSASSSLVTGKPWKVTEKRLKPHDSSVAAELMSLLSVSSNELCPDSSMVYWRSK